MLRCFTLRKSCRRVQSCAYFGWGCDSILRYLNPTHICLFFVLGWFKTKKKKTKKTKKANEREKKMEREGERWMH